MDSSVSEPEKDKQDEPATPSAISTDSGSPSQALSTPSTALLVFGFIIIALLGALIVSLVIQPPAKPPSADADPAKNESAAKVAARLRDDADTLASMVGELNSRLAVQDAEITNRTEQTVAALAEQKRLFEELERTRADLNRALGDAALAGTLRRDLDNANVTIASLRKELAQLENEPIELRSRVAELESLRRDLEARIASLESQLRQSRLFAGTESQIMTEAVELFRELRKLEGKSDSQIATAYSTFGARLGARVLKTCSFPTGSAEVPDGLELEMGDLAAEVPEGAMIFVVGYASETGNVDNNRTLSSDRATAVARLLDAAKRPDQSVQAAYLGQTDRFSATVPERNQIVEVWQIVRKQDSSSAGSGSSGPGIPPPPLPGMPR